MSLIKQILTFCQTPPARETTSKQLRRNTAPAPCAEQSPAWDLLSEPQVQTGAHQKALGEAAAQFLTAAACAGALLSHLHLTAPTPADVAGKRSKRTTTG